MFISLAHDLWGFISDPNHSKLLLYVEIFYIILYKSYNDKVRIRKLRESFLFHYFLHLFSVCMCTVPTTCGVDDLLESFLLFHHSGSGVSPFYHMDLMENNFTTEPQ